MAVNPISAIAEQQFRDQYLALYQQHRMLAGTLVEVHNVVGDAYKWPGTGSVDMIDRGAFNSEVTASQIDHTQVTTNFPGSANKVSRLVVGDDEQTLISPNERQRFALAQAGATGRQLDQFQIDAMNTVTQEVIPAGGTSLTIEKLAKARTTMIKNNSLLPGEIPNLLIHANELEAGLQLEKLTSSDFMTVKNLMDGNIDSAFGFKWIIYGDSTLEGLPITGGLVRSCFAWATNAMGMAFKMDPRVRVVWEERILAWQSTVQLVAASSVLQEPGVIKILCDETP